mgnify:CR=1 FL=1
MTWTRKDFQQLAGVLHRTRNAVRDSGSQANLDDFDRMVLPTIVRELTSTNTRFDPMRFTQAVVTGKETT